MEVVGSLGNLLDRLEHYRHRVFAHQPPKSPF